MKANEKICEKWSRGNLGEHEEEVGRMEKHKLHNLISFSTSSTLLRETKELSNDGDMAMARRERDFIRMIHNKCTPAVSCTARDSERKIKTKKNEEELRVI